MRVARLIMVTDANNNKYYNMTELDNGTILVEYGRVDATKTTLSYPCEKWDSLYNSKIRKGYKDVTDLRAIPQAEAIAPRTFADLTNPAIKRIVDLLQSYASISVQQNYTISVESVTQRMIEEAQHELDSLSGYVLKSPRISHDELDRRLLKLFVILPRKMSNVRDYLFSDTASTSIQKVISREQDILDVMRGQVGVIESLNRGDEESTSRTILESAGIEIYETDSADVTRIKKLLAEESRRYVDSYRIINVRTRPAFESFVSSANNKKCLPLWHGSRNENWWSIASGGLVLRPSNAVRTGSMFGNGTYFANRARKSIGYTSINGSYWARGNSRTAFLGIFDVHVGSQLILTGGERYCSSLNEQRLKARGDYDSVYAKAGAYLHNDELIVYNERQSTIKYLVQIS